MARATLFVMATTSAGAVVGWALGFIGGAVAFDTRVAIASALALLAVGVGAVDALGRRLPLLQCSRETPKAWVWSGGAAWATRTGAVLGSGAFTRIGFWLWYAIPAGALLAGDFWLGAASYGAYGFSRSGGALLLLVVGWIGRATGRYRDDQPAIWLLGRQQTARRLAGIQLVGVGIMVLFGVTP
jgi:hypothetical protein